MEISNSSLDSLTYSEAVILLLGDHGEIFRQIRHDLAETESRVIWCRTERSARKILERCIVDVLLIEPRTKAVQDISHFLSLRSEFLDQNFVVILLVSSMHEDCLKTAFKAGADDFIAVPYDRFTFMARIRTGVRIAGLHRKLKEKNENLSVAVAGYQNAFERVGALAHQLQEKNGELELLNDWKDDMVSIVAHDLRNPSSAIEMYANYLIEELPDLADEPKFCLGNIKTLVTEVLMMLRELLDISHFEKGKIKIYPDVVELNAFFDPIVSRMNLLFSQKGVTYNLDLNGAPKTWTFDGKRIAQALENLLSNAGKFSPFHSVVNIRLQDTGDFLRIDVMDKGPGIAESEIPLIFEKFHKGSAKPTAGESSTGLGLAIAKQIVEQHQGKIVVHSKVGEGSTFSILLPDQLCSVDEEEGNETAEVTDDTRAYDRSCY